MNGWIALAAGALLAASVPLRSLNTLFPWLGGYLLIYFALVPKSALTRFGKYGDFSYGVYIWAFPVQQVVAQHFSHLGTYFNVFMSLPFVMMLAIASWHLIEKPALAWRNKPKAEAQKVVINTVD